MIRKSFATLHKMGWAAFLLFLFLFAGGSWQSSHGFIGLTLREIIPILRDADTQWMVFVCLAIYFTAFLVLSFRGKITLPADRLLQCSSNPAIWLGLALFMGMASYATQYLPSTSALTLLAGAVIGRGAAFWSGFEAKNPKLKIQSALVALFILLLALASVWDDNIGHIYAYHSHTRWTGPWDNPNIFGLLMGTGTILAVGQIIQSLMFKVQSHEAETNGWKWKIRKYSIITLSLLAIIFTGRGLLHSYSRGAWLATVCGLGYLIGTRLLFFGIAESQNIGRSMKNRWFQKNWLPLIVILMASAAICLWHFRHTDWHPARRALSVANSADFSSRNRVTAWVGDLQIMAEYPWFGAGWSRSEPLYEHYYLPPRLTESAAIQMNDYLLLGATLGVPALFCFAMYLGLSFTRKPEARSQKLEFATENSELKTLDTGHWTLTWSQATCRAGALVLMVGFWFDGGLFKLPTAATFWILLELGNILNLSNSTQHLSLKGRVMIQPSFQPR